MSLTITTPNNAAIQQKLEKKLGKTEADKVLARLQQPENAEELAVLERLSPEKLDEFLSSQPGKGSNTGNAGGTSFVDNFLGYLDSVASQWFGTPTQYTYTGSAWTPSGTNVPPVPPPPPPPPPPKQQQPQQPPGRPPGNSQGQGGGSRNSELFGGINGEFTNFGMPNGYLDITSDISGQRFF